MLNNRLKERIFVLGGLLLALAVSPRLGAQQAGLAPKTNAPRVQAAATAQRHSLWRVEGTHKSVYLLGSVHALKPEDYPLPPVIESAFTNSAIVAFEADVQGGNSLELLQRIMEKARLPEGQTLQNQISPELYTDFKKHIEQAQLPSFMFDSLKPSVAAFLLAALSLQELGLDPQYGLDMHFSSLAAEQHKQVEYFETPDFQIGLMTDMSKEEGELLLKSTLKDTDKMKTEFPELLRAWRTGDAAGLEKLLNDDSKEAPVIFKRLIADRNQRWLPKIEGWLQGDRSAIVVVGAGHLVGKEGVVELLRAKGWKVSQL